MAIQYQDRTCNLAHAYTYSISTIKLHGFKCISLQPSPSISWWNWACNTHCFDGHFLCEPALIICPNQHCSHYQSMPEKLWSRSSLPRTQTTATMYCAALLTTCSSDCCRYRIWQPGWSQTDQHEHITRILSDLLWPFIQHSHPQAWHIHVQGPLSAHLWDECQLMSDNAPTYLGPDRWSKFLVQETRMRISYKKLVYKSRTQNHPSFSYGKHGGRQRRRFSCSYKSVAIVFPALNDKITQLNSTQQTTYKKGKWKSLKWVSLQPWIAQYKRHVSCISGRIEFYCIGLWTCCHSILCWQTAACYAQILRMTLIWRHYRTQYFNVFKFR